MQVPPVHYGFCPLEKLTFKDSAKLTAFAAIFKIKSYFRWDICGSLFIQFHFLHIFDFPFTFSWVLIISDKLQWPHKGSWGTSWILPSKSSSKYFLKNIMTENIWKIFAPWRGPQVKLLFSTFFQVTVYLVDTSAQRVPDTRPEPELFVHTRSVPDFFSESSGISGIGYFRKYKLFVWSHVLLVWILASVL